jgi:hypothetical protein
MDKSGWLAACIALRMVGAVMVSYFWRWRKICTILQPMGSKGRYLKKCPKPRPLTIKKQGNLDYAPTSYFKNIVLP